MSAYTPGPWRQSPCGRFVKSGNVTVGAALCLAAEAEERYANARLMAAAPDLLDVLAAIVDEVDGEGKPYSADSWLPARLVAMARAAIDKANPVDQAVPV